MPKKHHFGTEFDGTLKIFSRKLLYVRTLESELPLIVIEAPWNLYSE